MSRRLAVWIVLLLAFLALLASSAVTAAGSDVSVDAPLSEDGVSYDGRQVQSGDSGKLVAIVPVVGAITSGDSAVGGSSTGSEDVVRLLEAVVDDKDRIDGLVLEIDSPGGGVLAAAEIREAIREVRDADIPIVAWMRDTAASAGYYIAAEADRIVAAPTTFTGSIGVILSYQEISGLADKVGVDTIVIKSGRLKDIGSPFRDLTAEERQVFQSVIDEAYGEFVGIVAKGRDMSEAEVREIADGRIYTGRQARENGLVDELGLRRDAYDAMAKLLDVEDDDGEELEVVEYRRAYGLLDTLTADAQPAIDSLETVGRVGSLLAGERPRGPVQRIGNGMLQLEYRAEL